MDGGGGAGGRLGGGVLRGRLGGGVAALAAVVVGLTLLLQGEPARDVVQLSRVGQVDQDLRKGRGGGGRHDLGDLTPDWSVASDGRGSPPLGSRWRSPCRSPTHSLPGSSSSTEQHTQNLKI